MKIVSLFYVGLGLLTCLSSGTIYATAPTSTTAGGTTTIDINNTRFMFDYPPRMTEVLAPVALQQNWYWPASKLYRLNSSELSSSQLNSTKPEQQRALVLQQLAQLQQSAEPALQTELATLQLQVKNWRLAERIVIPIDYDLARAQVPFNRRFEPGLYKLQLVARPEQVHFWGAVTKNIAMPHSGATAVADYMSAIERSDVADSTIVYIMQPDGRIIKAGVAAWNQLHIEAMPGAQIFIPFASGWFGAEPEKLNQNLLALALHRVVE